MEKAAHCSGCGEPWADSTARENQLAYRAEVLRCHSCAERDRTKAAYDKQDGADSSGIYVRLTRRPGRTE